MKDLFSQDAGLYARYRPQYPQALYEWLYLQLKGRSCAWDCATGNGQVAVQLARHFEQVYATDISAAQLKEAPQLANIQYSVQPAEGTSFPDQSFDLITTAQAIHWFNFENFYAEVRRTAKPGAILAVIGYGNIRVSAAVDWLHEHLHQDILDAYWDPERVYVDEAYQTIPFPFKEIIHPDFFIDLNWSADHLIAYLNTWSAVKHYERQHGANPVTEIAEELRRAWGTETYLPVRFPLLLRTGEIHNT